MDYNKKIESLVKIQPAAKLYESALVSPDLCTSIQCYKIPPKNQMKLQRSIYPYDLISYRRTTKHVKSFCFLTCVKNHLSNLLISKQDIHIHITDEEPNVHKEGETGEERIKGEN